MAKQIPPRVLQIIPRLASDQDGEVVATARAIVRALKAEGMDLHDLVKHLGAPPKPQPQPQTNPYAGTYRRPEPEQVVDPVVKIKVNYLYFGKFPGMPLADINFISSMKTNVDRQRKMTPAELNRLEQLYKFYAGKDRV